LFIDQENDRILDCSLLIESGSDFFDGVFARLKRETGQNCALNGTIRATAH
jgi:hypothetical protein